MLTANLSVCEYMQADRVIPHQLYLHHKLMSPQLTLFYKSDILLYHYHNHKTDKHRRNSHFPLSITKYLVKLLPKEVYVANRSGNPKAAHQHWLCSGEDLLAISFTMAAANV